MAAKNLAASGVLYTDRRDFYIDPQVVKELWTDVAPFTTVLSNKETRQTNDPVFKMFEHRNPWVKQEFSSATDVASQAADDTESDVMDVDGITGLNSSCDASWRGLIADVWNENKDTKRGQVMVSSITDSNTIKFKVIGSAAIDVADNDVFVVVGNAQGEGTEAPEAWADELQVCWNSCQIFKTPLEITGTLLQASLEVNHLNLLVFVFKRTKNTKCRKKKLSCMVFA